MPLPCAPGAAGGQAPAGHRTGTFTPIAKTYTVSDRSGGTYAYRVRALYADGAVTRASNVETVTVR